MEQQAGDKNGFSLLELVVVVAVLAILAAIGIPMFNFFVKQAAYVAGQWSLASARSSCAVSKSASTPTGFFGTQFSSSNSASICDGDMTASFDGGCQISINLKNGGKTSSGIPGWPSSLDACSNQSLIASQQSEDSDQQADSGDSTESDSDRDSTNYTVLNYGRVSNGAVKCGYDRQNIETDIQPLSGEDPYMPGQDLTGNPPGIMVNSNGSGVQCKAVRIPASFFEGGVLPRPFEIKASTGIVPSEVLLNSRGYGADYFESSRPQRLFDSEGYPIAIVGDDVDLDWLKERYPDIDTSIVTSGIDDPR